MEKRAVQHRALIKAVLWGCPLTGSPVNLPFNWRGHKKKGAAFIQNILWFLENGQGEEQLVSMTTKQKSDVNTFRTREVGWHIYIRLKSGRQEVRRWKGGTVMERDGQRGAVRVTQGEEKKDNGWGRESNGGRQIEMAGSERKGHCVYMCERTSKREVK